MSDTEKRFPAPRQHEWTKPQVKRVWAGSAEGASNGGQDFGTGQS